MVCIWVGGIAIIVAALLAALHAYIFVRACSEIGHGPSERDFDAIIGSFLVLSGAGVLVALLTIRNARAFQLRGAEGPFIAVGLVGSTALVFLPILIALLLAGS